MSLFNTLTTQGLEDAQDRLGGFQPLESDIYTGIIKAAYAGKSSGGAVSVTFLIEMDGKEYRETFYVTNKKGENFFLNKQDNSKKVPLPGFTLVDDICLVTTDKPLSMQDHEDKVIKVYDADAKKELPKSVPMLVDLIGKEVSLGILKSIVNKNEKVGNEYVPTAETREENTTDKVFHTETKMTVVELKNEKTEPAFWNGWLERNKGNTRDKRTVKDGVAGASATAPKAGNSAAPAANAPARTSLFGKKS